MYRLKLRIRFVLSDKIARQKTRFFDVRAPPAEARPLAGGNTQFRKGNFW
jgi:hypothetical protein